MCVDICKFTTYIQSHASPCSCRLTKLLKMNFSPCMAILCFCVINQWFQLEKKKLFLYYILVFPILFVDESQERLQCKRTCMTCIRLECILLFDICFYMPVFFLHACEY